MRSSSESTHAIFIYNYIIIIISRYRDSAAVDSTGGGLAHARPNNASEMLGITGRARAKWQILQQPADFTLYSTLYIQQPDRTQLFF